MAKTKKKIKLFYLIGTILSFTVFILCSLQTQLVSYAAKKKIEAQLELEYRTLCTQTAESYGNIMADYISKMEFYSKSDVVRNGGNSVEIYDWLRSDSVVSMRSPVFAYVAWVEENGDSHIDIKQGSNVATRDYYLAIMNGADYAIDNPVAAKATGKMVVHVCTAARQNGKTIGLFYGNIDPTTLSDVLNKIDLQDVGYATIFGGNGYMIGSSNQDDDQLRADMDALKENNPELYAQVEQAWLANESFYTLADLPQGKTIILSEPIPYTDWNLILFLDYNKVFETADYVKKIMIIGLILLVVLILIAVEVPMYYALKPVSIVEQNIKGIATGEADLTKRIDIKSNNEIGGVVEGFNMFSEKLQSIVTTMKDSKEKLVDVGELLQDSTTDTANAINEIIGNIKTMDGQVNIQTDSVSSTAGAVNQIASNIESLNRMIESQSAAVSQASAAIQQMIGNINAVNTSMQKMNDAFIDLEKKTVTGVNRQNDVNEKIAEIEKESEALQEANIVIKAIAEQTNLLAMNAAIEAAHAGDSGKGFSVVADEIRKLSEDSGNQTQTIGNQLTKITTTIQDIVTASQLAAIAFTDVAEGINHTTGLVKEISQNLEEQNSGSQQISIALNTMNDTSNEVKIASIEMAEGNKQILQEIKTLQDATFNIRSGMDEMEHGATKISETGAALSDLSNEMDISIKHIGEQVDKFKV